MASKFILALLLKQNVDLKSKAKMAPKTMPQDSFVTDGKSKTKDHVQYTESRMASSHSSLIKIFVS